MPEPPASGERRAELLLARLCGATRGQVTRALTLEAVLRTLAGIAVGAAVVLISVSGAGHDPTGGPLVIPGQAGLVVAAAAALGLAGSLLPAALTGHGRMGSVTELGDWCRDSSVRPQPRPATPQLCSRISESRH